MPQHNHLLKQLTLPDRYETLSKRLGPEVVQLLLPPPEETSESLERAALAMNTRSEGIFIPLFGQSGTGKTTLAQNVTHFLPDVYAPTCTHEGDVSYDELRRVAENALRGVHANEQRILPINIDHRENSPPSATELAEIKRFLRNPSLPVTTCIFWPDTSRGNCDEMSARYVDIAGRSPINLPLLVQGPETTTWQDIAINTLKLSNDVEYLEDLGVNPRDYDPARYRTLGEFLRVISDDFNDRLFELRKETRQPITLVVVFVSESQEPGVLTQLTSASRYGLLDGHALVGVTSQSELGKWWTMRKGLLTRAIVQLNAHALHLPPGPAISVLRTYGSKDAQSTLGTVGLKKSGPNRVSRDVSRSDLGKFLLGEVIRAYETRGTPPETATAAFGLLAGEGFIHGKDKDHNRAMGTALRALFESNESNMRRVTTESRLDFSDLRPDNAVYFDDSVMCIEYTWRKGDFLSTSNRATTSQYILKKLRDYVRQLGWTSD